MGKKKGGGRTLNPTDVYRKQLRKKEIAKNKRDKQMAKLKTLENRNADDLKRQLATLQGKDKLKSEQILKKKKIEEILHNQPTVDNTPTESKPTVLFHSSLAHAARETKNEAENSSNKSKVPPPPPPKTQKAPPPPPPRNIPPPPFMMAPPPPFLMGGMPPPPPPHSGMPMMPPIPNPMFFAPPGMFPPGIPPPMPQFLPPNTYHTVPIPIQNNQIAPVIQQESKKEIIQKPQEDIKENIAKEPLGPQLPTSEEMNSAEQYLQDNTANESSHGNNPVLVPSIVPHSLLIKRKK